tara:strand:- start:2863 stop:4884 length:2022 start_codon:yes stop_codon:yes gene_type:complete
MGDASVMGLGNIEDLRRCANTVRGLAMDAVQRANSGHPGLPMGMADVAVVLWSQFMCHDPSDVNWINRDRFVLSAGHGSMLLYALLHLSGYAVSLDDIKEFRQWGSITPGHPEYSHTPGVETTTGPLGQGLANAVGMAMAERWLATRFNKTGMSLIDHYTYVIAGDGCLMEGISHEACSFAGHNKLGKLIVLWDDNKITIDGETKLSTNDDVIGRFKSYGWHTITADGHSYQSVSDAIDESKHETDKPSLIACSTIIGFGSPNRAATAKAHGEPLGDEEIKLTKEKLGLPIGEDFYVDTEAINLLSDAANRGLASREDWNMIAEKYLDKHPTEHDEFTRLLSGEYSGDLLDSLPDFAGIETIATRAASGTVLQSLINEVPNLIGGSADLTGSNSTLVDGQSILNYENQSGRYIYYGVREHAMGAIMSGISLHGGLVPYGGTFLVFADYMRPAIRLASMMGLQVIYVFTHDSIGVGEDGPTHQPIEHLLSLRSIPGLTVIRPADATETSEAWKSALTRRNGPTALVLTRQKLPVLHRTSVLNEASGASQGGYVLRESNDQLQAILLSTGSEIHVALEASAILEQRGVGARVVSMPSFEIFDEQSKDYREHVLPSSVKVRVAIEAGVSAGWDRFVGEKGRIIGIDRFGASAPAETVYKQLGLTADNVVDTVLSLM